LENSSSSGQSNFYNQKHVRIESNQGLLLPEEASDSQNKEILDDMSVTEMEQ